MVNLDSDGVNKPLIREHPIHLLGMGIASRVIADGPALHGTMSKVEPSRFLMVQHQCDYALFAANLWKTIVIFT